MSYNLHKSSQLETSVYNITIAESYAEYLYSYDCFAENGAGGSIGPCMISPFKVHPGGGTWPENDRDAPRQVKNWTQKDLFATRKTSCYE